VWQFLLKPNLPAVAATATGFAMVALVGRAVLAPTDPGTGGALRPTPLQLFQTYFPLDLLTYTAFVGTLYAFHYYREARRREITASQLQASLAEARLGGLEARIDPDFLFNTLTDISALAGQGLQKPVIDRLGRLSEVLRAALSDQRPEEIPLRQELTLLDGYLSITDSGTLRRHQFLVDAAPGVLTALVPRMMLPTIAEHILRRGKDEHGEAGTVTVRAKRLDETVRLDMTIAREPSSNGEWQDYESELDSLREQLHRLYGRSQTFELVTRGTGVVATIDIPFREGLAGEGGPTA
jgi:two-component system LytT family sensor kinase